MRVRCRTAIAALATVFALAGATPVAAGPWNDETILRFTAPVRVPGTTLVPGEYVFQIANPQVDRHVIRIFARDDHKLMATSVAVPIKRAKATDDVVLKIEPTVSGDAPIAIQAWFYPGSLYGHQFVYPDDEARQLAARSKALVLSGDTGEAGVGKGAITVINPAGARMPWHGDEATLTEWTAWRNGRTTATATTASTPGRKDVAVVQIPRTAMHVAVDDIEDAPRRYVGQRVSVDGEVERVFGPRAFSLDEPDWADTEGELLVAMPTTLAVAVAPEARVTVEGTIRDFDEAALDQQWGFSGMSDDARRKLHMRPVLVAERVVGGTDQRSFVIELAPTRQVGTSGTAAPARALDNVASLAAGDRSLVGRTVHLSGVTVFATTHDGFVLDSGGRRIFVLPATQRSTRGVPSERSVIDGVVLALPAHMADGLTSPGLNRQIYVYADTIAP